MCGLHVRPRRHVSGALREMLVEDEYSGGFEQLMLRVGRTPFRYSATGGVWPAAPRQPTRNQHATTPAKPTTDKPAPGKPAVDAR